MDIKDARVKSGVDKIGDGKLWSASNVLLSTGRYRVFRDGAGWFACDPCDLEIGQTVWLELEDGTRTPVQVSRLAPRNCLFRPAAAPEPEVQPT